MFISNHGLRGRGNNGDLTTWTLQLSDLPSRFPAIENGQLQVKEYEVGRLWTMKIKSFLSVAGLPDLDGSDLAFSLDEDISIVFVIFH